VKRVSCSKCFKNFILSDKNKSYSCPYCQYKYTQYEHQISTNLIDIMDNSHKNNAEENQSDHNDVSTNTKYED
jgi:hypothetical protein